MGYEIFLVILMIDIFGGVFICYTKKRGLKILIVCFLFLYTPFFLFISPSPLGIKNEIPYVTVDFGEKDELYYSLRRFVVDLMEKAGFEFGGEGNEGTD